MRPSASASHLTGVNGTDEDTKHGPAASLQKHDTMPNLRTVSQRSSGSSHSFVPASKSLRTPSRSLGVLLASSQRQRSYAPVRTGPVMKQTGLAAGPAGVVPATSPTRRMLLQKHQSRLRDLSKRLKTSGSSESSAITIPPQLSPPKNKVDPKKDHYNFEVHNKRLMLAPRSLFLFGEESRLRQAAVWLVTHRYFDGVVLALIIINSVVLAITDYSLDAIDEFMDPDPTKSWRNSVLENTVWLFTILFTLECLCKVVAMGWFLDPGSYLRDSWNVLDFLVVVSSLLTSIPGIPRISALRVFRVLRPLRTIEFLPGLKLLVSALLRSLPQLGHVVMLLTFIFSLFGILGLQIWAGNLHARCRMTEYPVQMPYGEVDTFYTHSTRYFDPLHKDHAASVTYMTTVLNDRAQYPWCGSFGGSEALPLMNPSWSSDTSPWRLEHQCVWPILENDTKLCSLYGGGAHSCSEGNVCGSDFDEYGNERFAHPRAMRAATFLPEFMFGYPGFDWIFPAFLTIFECITLESWAEIMYMVQDSSSSLVASLYFTILILFGSFLILNLTLAVIWGHLKTMQHNEAATLARAESLKYAREEHLRKLVRQARKKGSPSPTAAQLRLHGALSSPGLPLYAHAIPGSHSTLGATSSFGRGSNRSGGSPLAREVRIGSTHASVDADHDRDGATGNGKPRNLSPVALRATVNLERNEVAAIHASQSSAVSQAASGLRTSSGRPPRAPTTDRAAAPRAQAPAASGHEDSDDTGTGSGGATGAGHTNGTVRARGSVSPTPDVDGAGADTDTKADGSATAQNSTGDGGGGGSTDTAAAADSDATGKAGGTAGGTGRQPAPRPAPLIIRSPRAASDSGGDSHTTPGSGSVLSGPNLSPSDPFGRRGAASSVPSSTTPLSYPATSPESLFSGVSSPRADPEDAMESGAVQALLSRTPRRQPRNAAVERAMRRNEGVVLGQGMSPQRRTGKVLSASMSSLATTPMAVSDSDDDTEGGKRENAAAAAAGVQAVAKSAVGAQLEPTPEEAPAPAPAPAPASGSLEGGAGGGDGPVAGAVVPAAADASGTAAETAPLNLSFLFRSPSKGTGASGGATPAASTPQRSARRPHPMQRGPPRLTHQPRSTRHMPVTHGPRKRPLRVSVPSPHTEPSTGGRGKMWTEPASGSSSSSSGGRGKSAVTVVHTTSFRPPAGAGATHNNSGSPLVPRSERRAPSGVTPPRRSAMAQRKRSPSGVPQDPAAPRPKGTRVVFLRRKDTSGSGSPSATSSSFFFPNEFKGAKAFFRRVLPWLKSKRNNGQRLSQRWNPPSPDPHRTRSGRALRGAARCRSRLKVAVRHWAFNSFILLLITANTVVLALDQHPMDPVLAENLETVNFVLTVLFFLEMVLKIVALGVRGYVRDRFNVFDGFIVTVSILELVLSPPGFIVSRDGPPESGGAVSALRTFRLFRVFSIARSWVSLRMLLRAIVQTLKDVANFALLLLLFLYIFSIVGMQFFANRFRFDPETHLALTTSDPGYATAEVPRTTFDNLLWSLVTVFQVLTAENWNQVLHDSMRSVGILGVIYFVFLVVVGNFIVLNLFLAILLGNFEGLEVMTIQEKARARDRRIKSQALKALSHSYRNLTRFVKSASTTDGSGTSAGPAPGASARIADAVNRFVTGRTSPPPGLSLALGESAANDGATPSHRAATNVGATDGATAAALTVFTGAPEPIRNRGQVFPVTGVHGRLGGSGIGGSGGSDAWKEAPETVLEGNEEEEDDEERQTPAPDASAAASAAKGGAGAGAAEGPQAGAGADVPFLKSKGNRGARFGGAGGLVSSQALSGGGTPVHTMHEAPSGLLSFAHHMRRASAVGDPRSRTSSLGDASDDGTEARYVLNGKSLCVFGPTNWLRLKCLELLQHPAFDNTVLALIIVSSILLAVDTPLLNPDSGFSAVLRWLDYILTGLFTVELMVKVVVMGFVAGKTSYLRNGWNVLDFLIVCVSILSLAASGASELRSLRSLRTLRALRPLRVISRNPGLKLVVNALFRAIPSIINVLFVCVLFFLIFGIVGVSYFKGVFKGCQGRVFDDMTADQVHLVTYPKPFADLTSTEQAWGTAGGYDGVTSKAVCLWMGADWDSTIPQSFDNIIQAAGTLFEMSTKEGWLDVMFAGVDATDIDMQPIRDHSPGWVFFFIAFMIIGNFFIMNLFVGVVIDNFNRMKEEMGENMFLTDAQREWVKTQETLLHVRPSRVHRPPMNNYFRQQVFYLVERPGFELFILTCIIANTVIMAMLYFGQPDEYNDFLEFMNLTFAAIFTLEAAVKLIGLGGRQYFNDNWNLFDFTIVVGTIVGLVLKQTGALDVGSVATIVRTFRMGRLIRIIQSAKSLRALFNTLVVTLPSLANVGGLLFLLYFIYAVLGVQSFAHVKYGEHLNTHANFRSFGTAIVTLVRCSTGENWNLIMYEISSPSAPCNPNPQWNDPEPQGCGVGAAYLYFFTFTVLVAFVMLNVFIAVILEGFGDMSDAENSVLSKQQLDNFAHEWCNLDPTASMLLKMENLPKLFMALDPPLGFAGSDVSVTALTTFIRTMHLPTYSGNHVHFSDVLRAASKVVVKEDITQRGHELEDIPSTHGVHAKWSRIKSKTKSIMSRYTAQQLLAADTIKDCFNVFLFRKALAKLDMESPTRASRGPVSADDIRNQFVTEARQRLSTRNPGLANMISASSRRLLQRRQSRMFMRDPGEVLREKALNARLERGRSQTRAARMWNLRSPGHGSGARLSHASMRSSTNTTPEDDVGARGGGMGIGLFVAAAASYRRLHTATSPVSMPTRSPRVPGVPQWHSTQSLDRAQAASPKRGRANKKSVRTRSARVISTFPAAPLK